MTKAKRRIGGRLSPYMSERWTDDYGNDDRIADSFDPMLTFDVEQHLDAALDVLEAAGVPARAHLTENPGATMNDLDIYIKDNEFTWFSPLGVAAQIVDCCAWIRDLQQRGASTEELMKAAYRLGLLAALDWAYTTDDQGRGRGRAQRAANAQAESARRKRQWLKLRPKIRKERGFASLPESRWNSEADKRLAAWLRARGVRVTAKSIANQRSRERWLTAKDTP